MQSNKVFVCSLFSLFVLVFTAIFISSQANAQGSPKSGTKIAWGGMGGYGMGGYGRLLRLGTRSLYRGRRRGYGSQRRNGQFTYNHNRINNNMQDGYLNGSSSERTRGQSSQLWGSAQNRFDRRHTNNELWNRGSMQNPSERGGRMWGRNQRRIGQNLWGSQRGMANRGEAGMSAGGVVEGRPPMPSGGRSGGW